MSSRIRSLRADILKVSKRIKQFRFQKGLNQRDFAKKLGYSYGYIADLERGRQKPSRDFLVKMKEVFDVSIDDILYGVTEKTTKQVTKSSTANGIKNQDKKLLREVEEILKRGDKDLIRTLEATVKVFLNSARAASDRRKYPRTLLNLPVDFQIADEPGPHRGIIINMSQMGILLQTSCDISIGKKVNLELSMGENASAGTFRGKGEIIWKGKKHLEGSDDEYQYGIKLLEVLDEGHLKLELLIRGCDEKKSE